MPLDKSTGSKVKKAATEDDAGKKTAVQHAQQVKKDHRKLKPKAAAKKFEEDMVKVQGFEAEFKLLRLELLGKDLHSRLDSTSEMRSSKEGNWIQQEMRKLIETLEEMQPCWVWALERCSHHLRVSINCPKDAIELCNRVLQRLEDCDVNRPVDDKMLTQVPGVLSEKEEELGHHKAMNLDKVEDRKYLLERMQWQLLQAQIADPSSNEAMRPQWHEQSERLMKSTIARRERLITLYGAYQKKSGSSGNGTDVAGKNDEEKKLRRQLIEQEVARAKARELCSQQGHMDGMGEHMTDMTATMLRQQQQQMITQQGQMTAQQERMHRRLAKRKDEEKQSLGPPEGCSNVKASAFVAELSSQDLESSLRVECDKLWNQVLQAHSRLQQEQQSGIEYVHHIVAHTLNHPEARWLGRWYLGETFPFAHESQFLTIVSTLLWRTLVQTTKHKIIQRWHNNPTLKLLPWCSGHTEEEKRGAMQAYLMQHREQTSLVAQVLRPMLADHQDDYLEVSLEDVVQQCEDFDLLHSACMAVFEEQVRNAIYNIQTTMEDRVPFIRELEQNQECQLEHVLNVSSDQELSDCCGDLREQERFRTSDRSMEFVFWFLKDRITFDKELPWVLMHQVAQDLDQHFKDNPSHTQGESQVHDVAVLGREVGYVHAIKQRMLDLAPHYEVYGSKNTQDMLTLIMKRGEESKELQDDDSVDGLYPERQATDGDEALKGESEHPRVNGNDEDDKAVRNFSVHGKGFDKVVNHHENLETRRRHRFYEKMDAFIERATTWAAQMKVYSQLDSAYGEALNLRRMLVRLLKSEGGFGLLEEQHSEWLQHLVYFMEETSELAERLHHAHTLHSRILVRRILCALWNKQHEERRYMDDECNPDRKIEDLTRGVIATSREIEVRQKKMMQLRTGLLKVAEQLSHSTSQSVDACMEEEAEKRMDLLHMYSDATGDAHDVGKRAEVRQNLQKVDKKFAGMQRLIESVHHETQKFKGLQEELRAVTGPADQCVGQYHEVVRDIAICMIREEMLNKAKKAEQERTKREQEEEAKRAQEDLLKDEEEMENRKRTEEERKAKKKAKEREKKEKERLEKERIREEESKKKQQEDDRQRAAEEQERLEKEKKEEEIKRRREEERLEEQKREMMRQAQLKEQQAKQQQQPQKHQSSQPVAQPLKMKQYQHQDAPVVSSGGPSVAAGVNISEGESTKKPAAKGKVEVPDMGAGEGKQTIAIVGAAQGSASSKLLNGDKSKSSNTNNTCASTTNTTPTTANINAATNVQVNVSSPSHGMGTRTDPHRGSSRLGPHSNSGATGSSVGTKLTSEDEKPARQGRPAAAHHGAATGAAAHGAAGGGHAVGPATPRDAGVSVYRPQQQQRHQQHQQQPGQFPTSQHHTSPMSHGAQGSCNKKVNGRSGTAGAARQASHDANCIPEAKGSSVPPAGEHHYQRPGSNGGHLGLGGIGMGGLGAAGMGTGGGPGMGMGMPNQRFLSSTMPPQVLNARGNQFPNHPAGININNPEDNIQGPMMAPYMNPLPNMMPMGGGTGGMPGMPMLPMMSMMAPNMGNHNMSFGMSGSMGGNLNLNMNNQHGNHFHQPQEFLKGYSNKQNTNKQNKGVREMNASCVGHSTIQNSFGQIQPHYQSQQQQHQQQHQHQQQQQQQQQQHQQTPSSNLPSQTKLSVTTLSATADVFVPGGAFSSAEQQNKPPVTSSTAQQSGFSPAQNSAVPRLPPSQAPATFVAIAPLSQAGEGGALQSGTPAMLANMQPNKQAKAAIMQPASPMHVSVQSSPMHIAQAALPISIQGMSSPASQLTASPTVPLDFDPLVLPPQSNPFAGGQANKPLVVASAVAMVQESPSEPIVNSLVRPAQNTTAVIVQRSPAAAAQQVPPLLEEEATALGQLTPHVEKVSEAARVLISSPLVQAQTQSISAAVSGGAVGPSAQYGLAFRPDQIVATREYDLVWGPSHGEGLDSNGQYSAQDLGKGLDNPKGEYNCFLNVIVQSLWQLESFRDQLTELAQLRPHSSSGRDNLALLKSLAHVFQMLSGTPAAALRNNSAPPSPALTSMGGSGGAWGQSPASAGGVAWGAGGMGGRNLFVVDPAQCRSALSSIFAEQGRSQINEMADAPEALADVLEALNRAFSSTTASGDDPKAGIDLISSSFSLNYVEDMECDQCRYKMAQQTNTTFFHLAFPSQLTEVQSKSSHRLSPEQMLKEAYARESRECPGCKTGHDMPFTCARSLTTSPNVFSLVLAWATTQATHQDIEALFKQLPLTLDLADVYSGLRGPQRYRLRCMVCFYGQHYVLLAYKPRVRQWVQYDDTSVKAVGDWTEVEKRCKAGRFQPNVVFFERY